MNAIIIIILLLQQNWSVFDFDMLYRLLDFDNNSNNQIIDKLQSV